MYLVGLISSSLLDWSLVSIEVFVKEDQRTAGNGDEAALLLKLFAFC